MKKHAIEKKFMTLIEALVYIAVFMMVVGLTYQCFHMFLKNSQNLKKATEDIIRVTQIGDRWREDIRNADSIKYDNGILFLNKDGRESCYSFKDNALQFRGAALDSQWKILSDRIGECIFTETAHKGFSAWEMNIELKVRNEKSKVKPLFSFMAVNKPK